jgi:hypothetical protein
MRPNAVLWERGRGDPPIGTTVGALESAAVGDKEIHS